MTETTDPATAPSTPAWKRVLTIVIPLLILALALHGLANEFDENGYRAIRHAFHQLSGTQIALTVVLGLASYACLIGFDAIGLRRSGIRVHPARIGITAFLAHTLGQTVGFAALTGGAVRLRGYRTAGLDLAQIGQVVLMSTLGFVFGAWLLISVALCMEPAAAALALPLDPDAVRVVGIVALLAYAATLLLVGRDGRQFSVFGHALWLPDRRTMIGVTVLSVIELVLASAAFYVLLPDSTPTGLPGFVGLYLVAVLAGLVSTVPAGLGVFEWSLLKLLPQVAPAAAAGGGVDLPRHLLRAAPAAGHPARACTRAAPAAAGQCRGNPCRLERAAPMVAADHRAGGVQHRCCAGHRRHVAHAAPSPGQRITADPGNVPSDRQPQRRRPAADRPGPGPAQPCRMDAGDGRVRDHPVATVAARWPTVDRGLRPAGGDGAVGRTPRVLPPGRAAR